jgi:hypothetical protein
LLHLVIEILDVIVHANINKFVIDLIKASQCVGNQGFEVVRCAPING